MTHFKVLVIIPRSIYLQCNQAIRKYIDDVMRKYSEHLEVEPYIVKTREELSEEFEKFKARKDLPKHDYKSVDEFAGGWFGFTLDEKGNGISTSNPNSFYDWFVIGGRWDGILTDNFQSSENGFNFSEFHQTIGNNSISVKHFFEKYDKDEESKEKYTYHTILDKNGEVHQSREYGWWGTYDETVDTDKWRETFEGILKESLNDFVVSLDCHV